MCSKSTRRHSTWKSGNRLIALFSAVVLHVSSTFQLFSGDQLPLHFQGTSASPKHSTWTWLWLTMMSTFHKHPIFVLSFWNNATVSLSVFYKKNTCYHCSSFFCKTSNSIINCVRKFIYVYNQLQAYMLD